jgi:hypothetical protein
LLCKPTIIGGGHYSSVEATRLSNEVVIFNNFKESAICEVHQPILMFDFRMNADFRRTTVSNKLGLLG